MALHVIFTGNIDEKCHAAPPIAFFGQTGRCLLPKFSNGFLETLFGVYIPPYLIKHLYFDLKFKFKTTILRGKALICLIFH